ncbi:MAG: type I methionyl aminopeptidase [Dehalococcoidia bacterium]
MVMKSPQELEAMLRAGKVVAHTLAALQEAIEPGMRTKDLDAIAETEIRSRGAVPSFIGYRGFPASLCVSINEEIVHGIPGDKVIQEGDIVSMDVGAIVDGFHGDAAVTVGVGEVTPEAQRLIDTTRGALLAGIEAARSGARLGDVSAAVQATAESRGYSVVREYVGHGIGRRMHEEPAVPNYGKPGRGILLQEGMALAIEPMLNVGGWKTRLLEDNWTVVTEDGSLSAHFEHSIAITDAGPQVLTQL